MTKHPKTRDERLAINAKKKEKRIIKAAGKSKEVDTISIEE